MPRFELPDDFPISFSDIIDRGSDVLEVKGLNRKVRIDGNWNGLYRATAKAYRKDFDKLNPVYSALPVSSDFHTIPADADEDESRGREILKVFLQKLQNELCSDEAVIKVTVIAIAEASITALLVFVGSAIGISAAGVTLLITLASAIFLLGLAAYCQVVNDEESIDQILPPVV